MAPFQTQTEQITAQNTQARYDHYQVLSTDDKLALLYYIYKDMGDSVTPAAPNAANLDLAEPLVRGLSELPEAEQLSAMRKIVEGQDTPLSRSYGGLSPNNQLVAWYAWAIEMGDLVIDIPKDYQPTDAVKILRQQIANSEFESQISFLRQAASEMGYSTVNPTPTQAETGKTDSL
jgi:hypothetical protein